MRPRTLTYAPLLALIMCGAFGCSFHRAAPEHVPASTLLTTQEPAHHAQKQQRVAAMARDTSSKPERMITSTPRRAVASRSRTRSSAPSPATTSRAPAQKKQRLPALSTARRAAPATPARSYTPKKSPRTAAGEDPAEAASYVWERLAKQNKPMSEASRAHIPTMHAECKKRGAIKFSRKLKPGQVVFFHNTFDANNDGRNNDWYTHVAIVESIDGVNTATLASKRDRRTHTFHINLEYHDMPETDSGASLNSQLRARKKSDLPYTQYLAGELYAGTCTL